LVLAEPAETKNAAVFFIFRIAVGRWFNSTGSDRFRPGVLSQSYVKVDGVHMTLASSRNGITKFSSFPESEGAGDIGLPPPLIASPLFPKALRAPFCGFNNKYAGGTCYVVGRGPPEFDYSDLARVTDPVFFINDAICLEKHARSETFFFAHDIEMRVWLDGSMKATAVLPVDGTVLGDAPGVVLGHVGPLVLYHRGEKSGAALLRMSRDEVAERGELFVHSGTIHSLIHFIWFCGFSRAVLIGCDGINNKYLLGRTSGSEDGYDRRLQNRSLTSPWWQYKTIRRAQDLLTTLFCIEAVYVGTPVIQRRHEPLSPRPNAA
jgi:hypothetical protein